AQLHQLDGARGVLGLLRIEPAMRVAGIHGAEAARPRAHRTHQHDRGGARIPTLADVRTVGLFAHGRESMLPDPRAPLLKAGPRWRSRPQPGGQALPRGQTRGGAARHLDTVADSRKPLRGKVFLSAPRPRRLGYDRDALDL